MISSAVGDSFVASQLEMEIHTILRAYERMNYPLATCEIEKIQPRDSTSIDIILRIHEGVVPRVTDISVSGNTITDSSIFTREFFLNEFPHFDYRAIESSRNRLARLGIFSEVSQPEVKAISDSTIGLRISVSESQTTFIDGILGYNPPASGNVGGYLNGFISLGFLNIAGSARRATLDYRRETPSTQEISATYQEPWIFNVPINASISFHERDEDSIYTRTSFGIEPSFFLSNGVEIRASGSYDNIVPGSAHLVSSSHTYSIGLEGVYDSRDNIASPRNGFLVSIGGGIGSKSSDSISGGAASIQSVRISALVPMSHFSERLVFVPSIEVKLVTLSHGNLDESDLFRVGGLRSLRGYYESEFHISQYAIVHAEERLITGHSSFIGIFVDYGYLHRTQTPMLAGQTLYPLGYGVSLQFDTQLGLLSASIGLAKNETLDRAKLHFGIAKGF